MHPYRVFFVGAFVHFSTVFCTIFLHILAEWISVDIFVGF
jgi:hypothetical protein